MQELDFGDVITAFGSFCTLPSVDDGCFNIKDRSIGDSRDNADNKVGDELESFGEMLPL